MFDLSWSEILVIGTAAIIFIGPKELPGALRTLGQFAAKARSMAREFQSSVDDMIRESELQKIKEEVDKVSGGDLQRHIEKTIDPEGDINKALNTPSFTEPVSAPPPRPSADATAALAPAPSPPEQGPAAADAPPASDTPHKPAA
jgi:sec-independent protein translocase protein TatB